jgi:hypothetical protein
MAPDSYDHYSVGGGDWRSNAGLSRPNDDLSLEPLIRLQRRSAGPMAIVGIIIAVPCLLFALGWHFNASGWLHEATRVLCDDNGQSSSPVDVLSIIRRLNDLNSIGDENAQAEKLERLQQELGGGTDGPGSWSE